MLRIYYRFLGWELVLSRYDRVASFVSLDWKDPPGLLKVFAVPPGEAVGYPDGGRAAGHRVNYAGFTVDLSHI